MSADRCACPAGGSSRSPARMVAPSGPNGRLEAAITVSSLVPVACLVVLAFPVLPVASIAGLLRCYGRLLPDSGWLGQGKGSQQRHRAVKAALAQPVPTRVAVGSGHPPAKLLARLRQPTLTDRKSTRLNSSHVRISY